MWKRVSWTSAVFFFSVAMVSATMQASQHSESTTTSNASKQNPVTPSEASQAKAKAIYSYDCSMCHGPMGNGKTDLGKDATGSVSDLTDPTTTAHMSDTELFGLILNGKGKMPGEKGRLKDDEIRNLVTYVRGLAKDKTTLAGNPTVH